MQVKNIVDDEFTREKAILYLLMLSEERINLAYAVGDDINADRMQACFDKCKIKLLTP